jgi:hypothetical protein
MSYAIKNIDQFTKLWTNIYNTRGKFFKYKFINPSSKSPEISAPGLYYLEGSKDIEGMSGKFLNLTKEETPGPSALNREVIEELLNLSIKLGGLE